MKEIRLWLISGQDKEEAEQLFRVCGSNLREMWIKPTGSLISLEVLKILTYEGFILRGDHFVNETGKGRE